MKNIFVLSIMPDTKSVFKSDITVSVSLLEGSQNAVFLWY